nr:hypothetical protein [Tanacetum cinerariifolium]
MANPNPKDPNVLNEDVPEEDPYHLLDYDEEEDLKIDIEEEEPEKDPVEEPEPLAGHGDQFDAHPNLQPRNMNGWVDDNDDVKEDDDENEHVDIEEDDNAEIIFPYEVQGDQTSPPRDESSNSEFKAKEADDELKVEEADVELEVEEAGVEPEVEEAKIGKMERFYLEMVRKEAVPKPPSDDEGSEHPRKTSKKYDRDEGPSDPLCHIHERIHGKHKQWVGGSGGASGSGGVGGSGGTGRNADGTEVRGAGPIVHELTGCTYATFIKCDPLPFNGTEGAVGLCQWFEKLESGVLNQMKGMDIDGYTNRFHELALLCPRMVEPEAVKVEQYLRGLTKSIRGDVTSSQPATINDVVRLAYQLVGQLIQDKANEATEGEKRKGEGDRGSRGDNRREYNRRQKQRRGNVGAMTNAAPNNNEICQKCKNQRHAGDCWRCTKCGSQKEGLP